MSFSPAWSSPGYGRRPSPSTTGTVLIRFVDKATGRKRSKRVGIAPAFDPLATTMTPIPGWTAASAAVGKAA